jgi:hypothetical protein
MQRDSSIDGPRDERDDRDAEEAPSSRDDAADAKKKERVIHTRVPAVLEQELKRLADNIRVPVSNLIRTILEDAVDMADRAGRGVESELHRAATVLHSKRESILSRKKDALGKKSPLEGVIGFQPLTLASDARCARCDAAIDEGEDAFMGVGADPTSPRVVVCTECVPRGKGTNKKEKGR